MGVTRADGDLTDQTATERVFAQHAPDTVIHCAAYADVDGCTRDPQRAWSDNAEATAVVARECALHGCRLVFVSTDYVFSGTKPEPYGVDDVPDPVNPYGESKLAGERAVAELLADYLIVRTQWLYGPGGRNFISSVCERARSGQPMRVVADEYGSPTYTSDLATALWEAAISRLRGIVHVTNSGTCSRLELAQFALRAAGLGDTQIEPIKSSEWPSPTVRPLHAILDNSRWVLAGHAGLRPWQPAVADFVSAYLST